MSENNLPAPLRWLFFVVGVGALISCGIYLGIGASDGFLTGRILRVVIFGLLGMYCVLRYGMSKRRSGPQSGK